MPIVSFSLEKQREQFFRNLKDLDVFSKSDPMCVIYQKPFGGNDFVEIKRTECIHNSLVRVMRCLNISENMPLMFNSKLASRWYNKHFWR